MIGTLLVLLMLLVVDVMTMSLNIVVIAGIVAILGYRWNHIFNKAYLWYIGALIIAVLALLFPDEPSLLYVRGGYLGYGIFLITMMVGVLPNKWSFSRQIKMVRGEFSILGFILISPHALGHVFELFDGINLFGIAAYVLMIPLTIVSFKVIKKEIAPKDWLRVQQTAYLIYLSLFVHLLMVADWQDKLVYAVLLTLYVNNKLMKEFNK